ncbi:MAG: hypothetical protein KA168_04095 [Chitinophagales bacterium]|jgi:hypothetical protein|nr:hypothetical protein [Chitinophagales bacterium]
MKNSIFRSLILFAFVALFSSNVQAQYNGPITPITYPGWVSPFFKPDLLFTSFTVNSVVFSSSYTVGTALYRRYTVGFTATVKNNGNANSVACNLEPESKPLSGSTFFYGGCQPFAALNAGVSRTINGTTTISVLASQHQGQVRLYIDSPCAEEFLPAYIKVNESNENNNLSNVINVTLP